MKNSFVAFTALFIYTIFGCTTEGYSQQNIQYTQYMYDGSLINPAFTGAYEALNITLLNRDQWSGVPGAPTSQTLSAHTLFKKKQLGTGLIIHREKLGIHQNLNAALNFAYHLQLAKDRILSVGLNAGVFNTQSNYQSLQSAASDPTATNSAYTGTQLNTGFGIYYRSNTLEMGYSIPSVLTREVYINDSTSIDPTKINHLAFAKYAVPLGMKLSLIPSVLMKYYPGLPISYDINTSLSYNDLISAGVSYRANESVDFLIRLQLTPQFQIGYGYDYPISNVSNLTSASNEIMLRYLFKYNYDKVKAPR